MRTERAFDNVDANRTYNGLDSEKIIIQVERSPKSRLKLDAVLQDGLIATAQKGEFKSVSAFLTSVYGHHKVRDDTITFIFRGIPVPYSLVYPGSHIIGVKRLKAIYINVRDYVQRLEKMHLAEVIRKRNQVLKKIEREMKEEYKRQSFMEKLIGNNTYQDITLIVYSEIEELVDSNYVIQNLQTNLKRDVKKADKLQQENLKQMRKKLADLVIDASAWTMMQINEDIWTETMTSNIDTTKFDKWDSFDSKPYIPKSRRNK
jgi:hypothetical protein